jgi:SAM-dependent methyltransferase
MRLFYRFYNFLRGTFFHPQWLSDRFHFHAKEKLRRLENCIILDIGSGNSKNSKFLNNTNKLYRLDYPTTNKRYFISPEIFGDACALPIASKTVDVVLLFEVLEHISNYENALQEIYRVLKPGGQLFISVPFIYPVHDAPYDFRRFTHDGLRNLLTAHHFVSKQEFQHGNPFLVAFQLLNLALLETAQVFWRKNFFAGIFFSILAYPLCLLDNFMALPFIFLPSKGSAYFGCFVIAERRQDHASV